MIEKGTMPFDVNLVFPEAPATLARMDKSLRINSINSFRFASSIVKGPAERRAGGGCQIMYRRTRPIITNPQLLIAIHSRAPRERTTGRVRYMLDEFWTFVGARAGVGSLLRYKCPSSCRQSLRPAGMRGRGPERFEMHKGSKMDGRASAG